MLNLLVQVFDRTPERMLIDPTITIGALTRQIASSFGPEFYSALLGQEQFVPEYALLEARQSIYRQHNEDFTWLTSVLTSVPHRS